MQALPLALMAGGAILKGVSSLQAGNYNRKVDNANAANSLLEGNEQAARIRDAARIRLGEQFGAQAESGFMVNQGSALDNLVESATNSELEAMDALRTAQTRAAGYRSAGVLAHRQGVFDAIGDVVSGAASAIGGMSDYANAGSQYGAGGG